MCTIMNLSEDGTMICVGALSQLREKKKALEQFCHLKQNRGKMKEKRKRKNPCIEKYSDFGICH